jgi:hypothetical protein
MSGYEATGRYRGLRTGQRVEVIQHSGDGLLVKPEIAFKQQEANKAAAALAGGGGATITAPASGAKENGASWPEEVSVDGGAKSSPKPTRYYGTVALDATRVGRDAGRAADEVIAYLSGLMGSAVSVTLEINAIVPDGIPDKVIRTVTENSRTLKFTTHGFEKE